MKKTLLLIVVLFISAGSIMAQEIKDRDYCIMQDGQIVMYEKGMPKVIKEAVTLKNGTVISPDGSYTSKTGKNGKLAEGECFGMSGHKYKSESQLIQAQQRQKKKLLKKTK
ncbi:MAG: hypothetical protein KJP09_05035 [Bacteroidia bacterium]|nr:hypothetical protein [Bacteroidia bacterium]NND10861.1 hypothetical protein [Flavobacteriaceae bacterium]MBT8310378.1 hypothetical protein [Bacteroidia bacterium]NNK28778.1 hypothetical protein [Flavobacteriaceae bacterium]NNL60943.1 hypothetical protein [Flavobacteriaceae bacterium]